MRPIRLMPAVFLTLSCFGSAVAGDAVSVDASGNTTFSYPVKGPYLAALKPASQSFSDAVKPTLDASSVGCMYAVSGISENYPINLPSAATAGAGAVIAFSVDPWATANKQYILTPVAGQTIDGRPSTVGLVLVHTNFVMLLSDGSSKWISMIKKVDTDWVLDGTIDIKSSETLQPVKGAVVTGSRDYMWWKRSGDSVRLRFEYVQKSAGQAGNGDYLFRLPTGFYIDSTKVAFNNLPSSTGVDRGFPNVGSMTAAEKTGATIRNAQGEMYVYNNNQLRCMGRDQVSDSTVGASFISLLYPMVSYSGWAELPVVGW